MRDSGRICEHDRDGHVFRYWRGPTETIDTRHQRVTVRTQRGNLYIGPHGRIDGLWRLVRRELRTNEQVRELAGGITRTTLLAWRRAKTHPFPEPVVTFPAQRATLELWSRTEVEDWLRARGDRRRAAEDDE